MKPHVIARFIIVWIGLLFLPRINAQQPFIRSLSVKDGLPNQVIYDLYASKSGVIYIGSEIGLMEYNGISFTLHPFKGNKGNSIDNIQEDTEGNIWCMNFANQIFQLKNDTLVEQAGINQKISEIGPLRSYLIVDNDIWLITEKLIFKYEDENIYPVLEISSKKPYNNFSKGYYDPLSEQVFISDQEFIYTFSKEGKRIDQLGKTDGFTEFIVAKNDIYSCLKTDLLSLKNETQQKKISNNLKKNYLNYMVYLGERIWLCTNNGLYVYHLEDGFLETVLLPNTRVSDIVMDFNGGFWISSVEKGLFYLPSLSVQQYELSNYAISSVSQGPNNTIFAGTGNGEIVQFNESGKIIQSNKTAYFSEIEFLKYDSTSNLLLSSHGFINVSDNHYSPLRVGKNVTYDKFGNFILSTYNQTILINKDLTSPPNHPFIAPKEYPLYNGTIPYISLWSNRTKCAIFSEKENGYIIGASSGLFIVSIFGKTTELKYNNESIITSDLIIGQNNEIYIATLQHGILKLENGEISLFSDASTGLTSNTCKKIKIHDNKLIVITDRSMDRVDLKTKEINYLSTYLSIERLNIHDFFIRNNNLYLASNEGVIRVELFTKLEPNLPKVIELTGRSLARNLPGLKNLHYQDKDIEIHIDVAQFGSFGNFDFEYRLLGYDKTWRTQTARNNTFSYMALPAGKYNFEIRANVLGNVSEAAFISFEIPQPFFQTWSFFFSLLLISIGLIYTVVVVYINRLKKKQLLQEQLLVSQVTALRSQMNPHFIFNVLNAVQGLIYSNQKNEASHYLGRFSNLMRRTLEYSDQLEVPLEKEIEMLKLYIEIEAARFDDDFDYEFNTSVSDELLFYPIPSLIIQPFVENAIKHGLLHKIGPKKLTIHIYEKENKLVVIEIVDNGIGRKQSAEINAKRSNHNSFAISAIDSRIHLMNQAKKSQLNITTIDLFDNNKNPEGTKIIIEISLTHEV